MSKPLGTTTILDHPLIQHKISKIRDKNTGVKEFREIIKELGTLIAYEATRGLPLEDITVETPLGPTNCKALSGKKPAIIPILRAGLGMVDGILNLIPMAKVGHIGIYRDPHTLKPISYYSKLPPDIYERKVFVLDPMLATGGSAVSSIDFLKQNGAKHITLMCIIAAPEGLIAVRNSHPDVDIYCASLDERLNEQGYIVPGLGDAGDRIFGTQ